MNNAKPVKAKPLKAKIAKPSATSPNPAVQAPPCETFVRGIEGSLPPPPPPPPLDRYDPSCERCRALLPDGVTRCNKDRNHWFRHRGVMGQQEVRW